MRRALDAAAAVRGTTSPNPWVGAVLVRDGRIVATGATSPVGGPHAEAAALAGRAQPGDQLFVTLEPCVPYEGKRTQPCAEAILGSGIDCVAVALADPEPRVAGRGIALLREAGIRVTVGDGAEAAATLLRPYLKHRDTGRPYVIAKFAASLDGRIATHTGDSQWITGEAARDRAHQQRAWVDAVMVGSGTALADDPALTARPGGAPAARQPVRIVLDARGRTPPDARLFGEPGAVIVATTDAADRSWVEAIGARGAQVIACERDASGSVQLDQLLPVLAQSGIMSIWAEGGATLLGSLVDGGHVDEVWAFIAPRIIGGQGLPAVGGAGASTAAEALSLRDVSVEQVGGDVLVRGFAGEWSPAVVP